MKTFFTADLHLGHEGIIRHCKRPFESTHDMDQTIIHNWNSVVCKQDTVWLLGDFTLNGADDAKAYRERLNGKINLIWGNHDRNSVKKLDIWQSSQYATEINVENIKLILCHYGMRVWNKSRRGSLMLYGHSHGSLPGTDQSLDVGVDDWNFTPVTLEQIKKRMSTLPSFQRQFSDQDDEGSDDQQQD